MRMVAVKCFRYREEGHKCRECPLWRKKEKVVERVACPVQKKAHQQKKRKLRRVEEEEAVYMAKPQEVQQGWRRSLIEELRKRTEEHCGKCKGTTQRRLPFKLMNSPGS